jgi:Zn-dependent protease
VFKLDQGGVRLFRLFGIDIFLHWAWVLIAAFEIFERRTAYRSQAWNFAECFSLVVIVLMHELGHSLACRSVGGEAERIVLWPLGGVAIVRPPARPGAVLWSIAAGPLVNLVIALALLPVVLFAGVLHAPSDASHYLLNIFGMNALLLVFNLLPVYPLDGGQIVYALLWFVIGRARALQVSSVVGLVGAAVGLGAAAVLRSVWLLVLAGMGATRAWSGLMQARAMMKLYRAPRYVEASCPGCRAHPPSGEFWRCPCGHAFDTFAARGECPKCSTVFDRAACPECRKVSPFAEWLVGEEKKAG